MITYEVVLKEKNERYYSTDDVTLRFPDIYQACSFVEKALPHMVGDIVEIKKVSDAEDDDTAPHTHEQGDELKNDLPVL